MKFFHLADLHIGKTVNGFSLLEDQQYVLEQILREVERQAPDAVLIAGDLYDKAVPSAAAVSLFDGFLTGLANRNTAVLCISGNHDSPERIGFGRYLMEEKQVHMAGLYEGQIRRVQLQDAYGPVHFYLLPYLRPANVRVHFPEEKIESYQDAVELAIRQEQLDTQARNVLVAHQFVVAAGSEPERSDSETEPVGGVNSVQSWVFDGFDYVALGHLHGPQKMGRETLRYSGSPLKYSFSECRQKKSITVVEMGEKGEISLDWIPLQPLRDMRRIKGPFEALISAQVQAEGNPQDYLHITLTDEQEVVDAIGKLRRVYPNVMELSFDNSRTRSESRLEEAEGLEDKDPLGLFEEFFALQNGSEMSGKQKEIAEAYLNQGEDEQ